MRSKAGVDFVRDAGWSISADTGQGRNCAAGGYVRSDASSFRRAVMPAAICSVAPITSPLLHLWTPAALLLGTGILTPRLARWYGLRSATTAGAALR